MGEESVHTPTPRDLETRVAILLNLAKREKVKLAKDVALYIAQNVRSSASTLESALTRLIAHSSLTAQDITLNYTKQVLKNFINQQEHKGTVDPFQNMSFGRREGKDANITRPAPAVTDHSFIFCLLKTREGRTISRVRQELEVNMRERERGQLARLDAYERELERRARKRKRG